MKKVILASFLTILSTPIFGETVRYGYDAQGRMQVADSRRVGGAAVGYGYDRAGNRTVYQSALAVRAGGLPSGASLVPGQGVISPGGAYRFTLQFDGNLVLYAGPTEPLWATMTFQPQNLHLDMQADGNLILFSGSQAIWSTNTSNHPGAYFLVQDDSNIVVYDVNNRPIWARFGL